MLRIGCHLSSAKGYCSMAKDAAKIHANNLSIFLTQPRGGNAKEINPEDVALFLKKVQEQDLIPILCHAPYTLNCLPLPILISGILPEKLWQTIWHGWNTLPEIFITSIREVM